MENNDLLKYYKEKLKWNPEFASILEEYNPKALEGYLMMRSSIQESSLDEKTRELVFTILDSLDNEVEGAKSHAKIAIEAGLTVKELVEVYSILILVKGINTMVITRCEVIKAAEERYNEIHK